MTVNDDKWLHDRVERQSNRLRRADRDRRTILSQTVYLGTLGLMLVAPVIAGAYLGNWLDTRLPGYSISWTISLIFVGVVIGGVNVWLMIRE